MISATAIAPESASAMLRSRAAKLIYARPLLIALLIIIIATALRAPGSVEPDVAWQLWIGRQLDHGARLYADITDTNPPLWFWMAMPVARLSELFNIRSDHVLIGLIGCAAALALIATNRLLGSMEPFRRALFLAYAALTMVVMPWVDIGQREHIVLIGTIPYAALIAARRSEHRIPNGVAIGIGVGAALGFALKHYFFVVPVLLEAWLIVGLGRKWRSIRPETIAVASVCAAYGIASLLLAQGYFTKVVPMLLLAYGATGAKRLLDLFQPDVIVALASIALLISMRRSFRSAVSGPGSALLVASVGFSIVYFIQAKGWSYHALPMLGCAVLALAASLSSNLPRLALVATPALLCLPFTIAAQQAQRQPGLERETEEAVRGMNAGDTVAFISADPSFGWHVIPQRKLRFVLRSNGFWMMQAIVTNELRGGSDPRLTALGRNIVSGATADLECRPARRIIVARPSVAAARAGEFDILTFFLRDPEFASVLAHYRPVERTSVEVFELASSLPRRTDCPRWYPT